MDVEMLTVRLQGLGSALQRWVRNRYAAPADRDQQRPTTGQRPGEAGYTLVELLIVGWIIGILSVISLGIMNGRFEKAKLAVCLSDMRSIHSTVWTHSDGVEFPLQKDLWDVAWGGKKPGPYHYLTDAEDPNAGHGNDLDSFDEQNPGNAPRTAKDIKWVLVCEHDHRTLCRYVYMEDLSPPIVVRWGDRDDPKYHRFIHGGGGTGGADGTGGKGTPGGDKGT
jgi:type II secretory pathway pseudopilin PulG